MALTNITTFDLEAAPGGSAPVINASQGDIGRQFQANLYWNGETWTPGSGVTCKLRGHKPDNTVFEYTATISGSTVTFSTTEQMTIISGPVECELVFSQGGDVIASANFVLMVEDSPYNPDAPSESVVPGIEDLIEQTIGGDVSDEVDAWLVAHPEVTTTVQDGSITEAKLAGGAVTTNKIADDAITYAELAPNAVETSIIKNEAVTTAKLAGGAVTSAKVDADFLKTIENAYVTPEMFGAVGDGTTDDTTAVQNALNNGLPVRLVGSYKVTHLTLNEKQTICGGSLTFGDYTGSTNGLINSYSNDYIDIRNVSFDFGEQSQLLYGLSIEGADNVRVLDCTFTGGNGYALRLAGSSNAIVEGCFFHDIFGNIGNPGGAIFCNALTNSVINACTAKTLDDHMLYVCGYSHDITISNCIAEDGRGTYTPGSAYCIYADSYNITVCNCISKDFKAGIYVSKYPGFTKPYNINISNCIISGCADVALLIVGETGGTIENVTVSNCLLLNCSCCVRVRYAKAVMFDNINIKDCYAKAVEISAAEQVRLANFAILNNTVTDYPIIIGDSPGAGTDVTIENGYIEGSSETSTYSAIYARNATGYTMLKGIRTKNFANPVTNRDVAQFTIENVSDVGAGQPSISFGTSYPTTLIAKKGDLCWNSNPSESAPAGWICTAAGRPGTWRPFGTIS